MMKKKIFNISSLMIAVVTLAALSSCKKDGNPNNLPAVSSAQYEGKIDGYSSSDEIYPDNLVAYWSFDGTNNETKTGTAPTTTSGASFIPGGVKGQALSLNAGFLYYATQLNAFKTDAFKSFTVSTWVQILNNGSKRTMLMQLARPGMLNGNLDFNLNTNNNPASVTNYLRINPTFATVGGGRQDNVNAFGAVNVSPAIGSNVWVNLVLTYDGTTGFFHIYGDGVRIGNYPGRGTGNNLFKSYEPSEVIIGGNYNTIPGKTVNADVSYAAMTGNIDEIRIFNKVLPDAHIKALFNLGKAGK
ncbi:LamG domain-containing protein [Pedobacter cryophilus]|nr:LamG domain-containing protein [Pedobacter cryophilus]